MIRVEVPHGPTLDLEHAIFDFNGTLATDGTLPEATRGRLLALKERLSVHVLTADTYGTAARALDGLGLDVVLLGAGPGGPQKAEFVARLGAGRAVAIGNGRNDAAMLKAAALGIVILGAEGAAVEALRAADLVCPSIDAALECLLHPTRLVASLRP